MPPVYTEIPLEHMRAMLEPQGFEFVNVPTSGEYVFDKTVEHNGESLRLRVYTSISRYDGNSRGIGEDAIRIVAMYGNGMTVGTGRTNRTQNWKVNLQKRIDLWIDMIEWCDWCGKPMVIRYRKADNKPFYGCTGFPRCTRSHKIEG